MVSAPRFRYAVRTSRDGPRTGFSSLPPSRYRFVAKSGRSKTSFKKVFSEEHSYDYVDLSGVLVRVLNVILSSRKVTVTRRESCGETFRCFARHVLRSDGGTQGLRSHTGGSVVRAQPSRPLRNFLKPRLPARCQRKIGALVDRDVRRRRREGR